MAEPGKFETITGDHWKRSLRRARSEKNTVQAQLRDKIPVRDLPRTSPANADQGASPETAPHRQKQ